MNCNDNYKNALNKIKSPECCRKNCFLLGPTGPTGPQGDTGGILDYAGFYALMPSDNAATVAPGTDDKFPQDGPNNNSGITRINASSFNLAKLAHIKYYFK